MGQGVKALCPGHKKGIVMMRFRVNYCTGLKRLDQVSKLVELNERNKKDGVRLPGPRVDRKVLFRSTAS